MGLTIDGFIEKKNLETDLWEPHAPQYDDLGDLKEIELDRSYLLYSMLGNWRNTRNIKPILEKNRTFPEDMSEVLTDRLAYDRDELQNCLYLNELLNYDWDNQFVKDHGWTTLDYWVQMIRDRSKCPRICFPRKPDFENYVVLSPKEMEEVIKVLAPEQVHMLLNDLNFDKEKCQGGKYKGTPLEFIYGYLEWELSYYDIAEKFLNDVVSIMEQISETEEKNDVRITLVGC